MTNSASHGERAPVGVVRQSEFTYLLRILLHQGRQLTVIQVTGFKDHLDRVKLVARPLIESACRLAGIEPGQYALRRR